MLERSDVAAFHIQPFANRDRGREGGTSSHRVREQDAEGVEVRPRPERRIACELLRGHELGRSGEHSVVLFLERIAHGRDSEVDELCRPATPLHEDVGGLEITVNDADRVRGGETVEHLEQHASHRRPPRPLVEPRLQVVAFDELHREKRRAFGASPRVEQLHDVRMANLGDGGGFAHPQAYAVRSLHGAQYFDREREAGWVVHGAMHASEAAVAERVQERVVRGCAAHRVASLGAGMTACSPSRTSVIAHRSSRFESTRSPAKWNANTPATQARGRGSSPVVHQAVRAVHAVEHFEFAARSGVREASLLACGFSRTRAAAFAAEACTAQPNLGAAHRPDSHGRRFVATARLEPASSKNGPQSTLDRTQSKIEPPSTLA